MINYIAFLNQTNTELYNSYFNKAHAVRVSLRSYSQVIDAVQKKGGLWLDAEIDGLHNRRNWDKWSDPMRNYYKQFKGIESFLDDNFLAKPDKKIVRAFVRDVLGKCLECFPDAISVPQFPQTNSNEYSVVNRMLSDCSGEFSKELGVKLILPFIVTNQRQINKKTDRNGRVSNIKSNVKRSHAVAVWVVDESLQDYQGSETFGRVRFQGLIDLHREIAKAVPSEVYSIAGPYWAMNLILWAKGLVKHPCISIGSSFSYSLPGGGGGASPAHRVAIPPLRRLAYYSSELSAWIQECLLAVPPSDDVHSKLRALSDEFGFLTDRKIADSLIAKSYRQWLDELDEIPEMGRALALYNQFSSAYVLGKSLENMPSKESPARRPERVAEQFMLVSL